MISPHPFAPAPGGRPVDISLVRCSTVANAWALGKDAVPSIGLAYIAGALRAAGHHVSAVDGVGEAVDQYTRVPWSSRALIHGLKIHEIVERIDPRAEVIGVGCMFSVEWLVVRSLIEAIRDAYPRALIVMGGEHVTACPDYCLDTCRADVAVLGEGEETIVDLVNAFSTKQDFARVPGIVYRGPDGLAHTGRRQRIRAIDEIPLPDWSVFPLETYIDNAFGFGMDLGRSMPILASRGCPYQCTFCSSPQMWTTLWSARKPELLLEEMKGYMARYGVTNFDFYDLTAIVKKQWIVEFTKLLLAENVTITWQLPSGTRTEAIDDEVSRLLYDAGCRSLDYAPETGSPAELKRIKKKVEPSRMVASMRSAHQAGLQIKTNFILGLPGQTWSDVYHTFTFLFQIACAGVEDVTVFPFSPYPGSELFSQLQARGRVQLDEAYFRTLLAYTDPQHSVSYADFIGSRGLSMLNMVALAYFYFFNFLFRPGRLVRLMYGLVFKDGSTRLTTALATRRRKQVAMKLVRAQSAETVIIPATRPPRTQAG